MTTTDDMRAQADWLAAGNHVSVELGQVLGTWMRAAADRIEGLEAELGELIAPPSPLDQLAAWCEANGTHHISITKKPTRWWMGFLVPGGLAQAEGASIQEAAASLYKQVTQ